jgi:mannosidase alpha-like ER degradation enhancer 2
MEAIQKVIFTFIFFTQTLHGDIGNASRTLKRYHSVWRKFGFTPEFLQITAGLPIQDRESYPLRPGILHV